MRSHYHSKPNTFRKLATHSRDAVSLTAALLWCGLMMGLAWRKPDTDLISSLARALIGATFVYLFVFVGLYTAARAIDESARQVKRTPPAKQPPKPESSEEKREIDATKLRKG